MAMKRMAYRLETLFTPSDVMTKNDDNRNKIRGLFVIRHM